MRWAALLIFLFGVPNATAEDVSQRGADYALVASYADGVVGRALDVKVEIVATAGRKLNADFPTTFTLTAPPDVDVPRAKLTRGDIELVDKRAVAHFLATPRAPGAKQLVLTVRFATCTAQTYDPRKHTVTLALRVSAP